MIPTVSFMLSLCFCGASQGPVGGTGISGFPGLRVSITFFFQIQKMDGLWKYFFPHLFYFRVNKYDKISRDED